MKLFRVSAYVCIQNFRKWAADYRIWIIALLMIVLTHAFSRGYAEFCAAMDIKGSPWLFPFLYHHRIAKILFYLPLLLIFCDAPFIDAGQPYVMIRSRRRAWCLGQLSYIVLAAGIYFFVILLLSVLLILSNIEWTSEWGRALGTLGGTNAQSVTGVGNVFVNDRILYYFTPITAVWYTFLLSWLAGTFLGLLTYVLNSVTRTKSFGIAGAVFFLLLEAGFRDNPIICRISPMSWSNLDYIDIGGLSLFPSIQYVYVGFATLIIGLIAIALITSRKQPIHVLAPV